MIGKRCLSFSYLSENYSQNLRIFVSSNRDSKMFAILDIYIKKNPAPEKKRGFGLRLFLATCPVKFFVENSAAYLTGVSLEIIH